MQIVKKENLENLSELFKEVRFNMGKSVLDNKMGKAYADNESQPSFAFLLVRSYCFISGSIEKEKLEEIINNYNLKDYIIIPSDNLKELFRAIFKKKITRCERHSIKKNPKFNIKQLEEYSNNVQNKYEFVVITKEIAYNIKEENFLTITDDYEKNGIGYACLQHNEIIGVASSNIIYKDGIEVNIRIKDNFRKEGLATVLASKLILLCIQKNMTVSWDAANLPSLKLAEKLGFEYCSTYDVYKCIGICEV